ncbi:aspartate dehydrogenase [Shimia sagamensis]|uniref:L-aspartate dehydrogenase n=1 Tax=Shimia sagamensis TaxID=1566352 RepID=A0ABY1P359_9RHOB|nr:aspartate dehydrogenase [Shimia sagamensis]SMP24865.1 aspartate dehydrogenase [Shimia sagamensis]
MKVGIIGDGAIARYVRSHLEDTHVCIVRPSKIGSAEASDTILRVADASQVPDDTDLMIDCAGHSALAQHGPLILKRGIDLVTVSLGALADAHLHQKLRAAALQGASQLHLASGAIGALDCLRAAKVGGLETVTYLGRKPPQGWIGSPAESTLDLKTLKDPSVHFDGNAREAATAYPKNANVAAAVALAGVGFEQTKVRLIADPSIDANIHELSATGEFGSFTFRIEGKALPDNPKSSALAAMSVVAAINRMQAAITS